MGRGRIASIGDSQKTDALNQLSYTNRLGEVVRRSEGLAVASLEMFLDGLFSDDKETPHQVTGAPSPPLLLGAGLI
jgi:hypothetical protein